VTSPTMMVPFAVMVGRPIHAYCHRKPLQSYSSFSTYHRNCYCSRFARRRWRSWVCPTTTVMSLATFFIVDSVNWWSCDYCSNCWIANSGCHSQYYSWPWGPHWWLTRVCVSRESLSLGCLRCCLGRSLCYSLTDDYSVAILPHHSQFSWCWSLGCIGRGFYHDLSSARKRQASDTICRSLFPGQSRGSSRKYYYRTSPFYSLFSNLIKSSFGRNQRRTGAVYSSSDCCWSTDPCL